MLTLNIRPLLSARGIDRPVGFLRKNGFAPYAASQIANSKLKVFKLDVIEKLCLLLNCTPHDLLEWEPEGKLSEPEKYELSRLMREVKVMSVSKELAGLPLEKLERIHKFIEETKREG